jgi:ribosomal protein S18 acetylase RimI-like enzyme
VSPSTPGAVPAEEAVTTTIRAADVADLPWIRDLLSIRDSRAWDDVSTRWFMRGLDPESCLAWLALVGQRPAGLSSMYVRNLEGPAGSQRVGYWANLFVDPAFRDRMFYPRLTLAMLAAARDRGVPFIYASVRHADLAAAHTRLGFVKLGGVPLLAKPLRPARLAGKLFHVPLATLLSPAVDGPYGAWIELGRARVPHGLTVEEARPDGGTAEALVELLRESSQDRIADRWTPELFRTRYLQTREGTRYELLITRRAGKLVGGVITRIAERYDGILAGVVMDVFSPPGRVGDVLPALAEAERRAHRAGADTMIYLDGLGPEVRSTMRSAGYWRTNETYELMVWPKQAAADHPVLTDLSRWRFGFGDHDAF